jgi:hypothetical protein
MPYTTEEQASAVAGNRLYLQSVGSNRSKSSNGSKRFERIERLERFEPQFTAGFLLDLQCDAFSSRINNAG